MVMHNRRSIVSDLFLSLMLMFGIFAGLGVVAFAAYSLVMGGKQAMVTVLPTLVATSVLSGVSLSVAALRLRRRRRIFRDGVDVSAYVTRFEPPGVRPMSALYCTYVFGGKTFEQRLWVASDDGLELQRKSRLTFRIDPLRPENYVIVDDRYA
jgi:hypothetical protein